MDGLLDAPCGVTKTSSPCKTGQSQGLGPWFAECHPTDGMLTFSPLYKLFQEMRRLYRWKTSRQILIHTIMPCLNSLKNRKMGVQAPARDSRLPTKYSVDTSIPRTVISADCYKKAILKEHTDTIIPRLAETVFTELCERQQITSF